MLLNLEEESNNESIHQPVSSLANAKKNFVRFAIYYKLISFLS